MTTQTDGPDVTQLKPAATRQPSDPPEKRNHCLGLILVSKELHISNALSELFIDLGPNAYVCLVLSMLSGSIITIKDGPRTWLEPAFRVFLVHIARDSDLLYNGLTLGFED